jgi:hypothetical protein
MDEEKQRIKIAEACGWSRTMTPCGLIEWLSPFPERKYIGRFRIDVVPSKIPYYLNDLNAMADAVAYLTPEQVDAFAIELSAIVLENPSKAWWDLNANEVGHVVNATAAQRAEAFLKTLNLWEE